MVITTDGILHYTSYCAEFQKFCHIIVEEVGGYFETWGHLFTRSDERRFCVGILF